ncbi:MULTISPECIES: DEAD/DEAH box helicase [Bacillus]|uniref:DEAD/DEAH box helicase n=1 Tax=Bacillus TaxID=1386 RepID=UPI0013D0D664|nr:MULTISPECIES: DEAD/DEAH box helicase [Bacillus subtilis group]MBV7318172.1 DEAD/DEAH box helicase [Halalkalibacterium halodurans]QNS18874.1 DEAD/DEAH box helicase [Bacillus halotolerans]
MKDYFKETNVFIEGNTKLRQPQRAAHMLLKKAFIQNPDSHKIIVLPTGTGKTGVIGLSPYEISEGRVLIITPSLIIQEGISDDFDTRTVFNFWTSKQVIFDENKLPNVYRYAGYDKSNDKKRALKYLEEANIVIANIHKVYNTNSRKTLISILPNDFFDMIIIDEAHHSAADSWLKALEYFDAQKIVKLTATPTRADHKELDGQIIYELELSDAIRDGYIKNIVAHDYTTQKLEFIIDGKKASKEEALDVMDSNWVSRAVAYSKDCSKTIVEMSKKKLIEKRRHGNSYHQIIAVACSIEHAQEIKALYDEAGLSSDYVASTRLEESEKAIIKFKKGELDVLVNVNMLGEGFDHPNISIAAIFRPFRTPGPYAQFIGRALRKIQEDNPIDPIDNVAHVIYHKDLDIEDLWDYYTGEKKKAERKQRIGTAYEESFDKNTDIGEVSVGGEVIQTTKEFLGDGVGRKYSIEIEKSISSFNEEIEDQAEKMRQAKVDERHIKEFIERRKQELDQFVNDKTERRRADLIREELHAVHKQRIIDSVESLLEETQIDPQGKELPNNTSNRFLMNAKDNIAYCVMSINFNLKQRLKRGIDEWETYDFEQAEKLLPTLLERIKTKIEGID